MEKRRFFCIADDGQDLTGFVVHAYSREQIEKIFGLPNPDWVQIFEDDFEDNDIYKSMVKDHLDQLTFDVDTPTGPLEYYMRKNGLISEKPANE